MSTRTKTWDQKGFTDQWKNRNLELYKITRGITEWCMTPLKYLGKENHGRVREWYIIRPTCHICRTKSKQYIKKFRSSFSNKILYSLIDWSLNINNSLSQVWNWLKMPKGSQRLAGIPVFFETDPWASHQALSPNTLQSSGQSISWEGWLACGSTPILWCTYWCFRKLQKSKWW